MKVQFVSVYPDGSDAQVKTVIEGCQEVCHDLLEQFVETWDGKRLIRVIDDDDWYELIESPDIQSVLARLAQPVINRPVELWLVLGGKCLWKVRTLGERDALGTIAFWKLNPWLSNALAEDVKIPEDWANTFGVETSVFCHDENLWMPEVADRLRFQLRCGDVYADSFEELEMRLVNSRIIVTDDDEIPF